MRLHRGYAALTALLLAIEVVIALFVHDAIVRPYVGDALAVILVYTGLRAVTRLPVGDQSWLLEFDGAPEQSHVDRLFQLFTSEHGHYLGMNAAA